jgi:SEC-C motif-containing protein
VHYEWQTGGDSKKNWCECDGLLIYDDHLFVVEARGGAFTYTPPATDFPAYVESLRNLVLKPASQGNRFLEYLNSADSVPVFDGAHQQIGQLSKNAFRHVSICVATLDPFTELAAQVQHLRKIGIDVGTRAIWALSVDDLRVYADIFDDPLIFLHFVEQRMRSFNSEIIQSDDEIDYVGLYIKHNNFSLYAEEMRGDSNASIAFHGYRSDVDKFFRTRLLDPNAPSPLKQKLPTRLGEIIRLLSLSNKEGRTGVSSFLLDLAGDWRDKLSNSIDIDLSSQPNVGRPKPFSTHGNIRVTVFCWCEGYAQRDEGEALDHAKAVMLLNKEPDRLLLELSFTKEAKLSDISWVWCRSAEITAGDSVRLEAQAEHLREARLAAARSKGKIGRNDSCPCGSSKKYKRCCLNRQIG